MPTPHGKKQTQEESIVFNQQDGMEEETKCSSFFENHRESETKDDGKQWLGYSHWWSDVRDPRHTTGMVRPSYRRP